MWWFCWRQTRVTDPTADLPYAFSGPAGSGVIRAQAEDFQVIENLGFGPSGEGEHVFLRIRKRNLTTREVAKHIARLAGVRKRYVSYAGLKDRSALTTQVFSVHLPGMADPDWQELEGDNLEVLEAVRHRRKVRRGALRGNRFVLRIRDLVIDRVELEQRLLQFAEQGVPNYFGMQRFGRDGGNLAQARQLFNGELARVERSQKSILLSTVRSWLFNLVLAGRVEAGNWNRLLPGEVVMLVGSQRQFHVEQLDEILEQRVKLLDINPTGPLCGQPGRSLRPTAEAAKIEDRALADQGFWQEGLQRFGLLETRRPLRLIVDDLRHSWEKDVLVLEFGLPAGSYATTVLRELVRIQNPPCSPL